MPSIASTFENEQPTRQEFPAGKWIVSVDRGARRLAAVIALLESGTEPADLVAALREVHKLVNGGAS